MKHVYFLVWALLLLCSGCNFLGLDIFETKCKTYIPQKYKFGYQEAEIWTASQQMSIGDTVFIRAHIPETMMDSLSGRPMSVHGRLGLFFRLSAASSFTSTSPFAMDTTIVRVFQTYFDTFVRTGKQTATYSFDAVNQGGFWNLDIGFVAKKKGAYDIYPAIEFLQTEEVVPKGTCMLGDSEKYNAMIRIKSRNNRINEIYPILPQGLDESFGFIVE
ncbi:hypothetical protein SAMN04487996_111338 [Dyadobacter soli]|uniref:Uncharacterized protein n=1 Tax=Dyadobacter soli TaxID=659014 RepID=A0A1G7MPU1_9BACT|nr:hypothetical protein [Dyadobacter soli]SDF63676.1 hypothetical protein SAMN04487996_111338 [Dyadobacter soli]